MGAEANSRNEALPPVPITTYAFEEVAGAHQALEAGKTVGKLVLLTQRDI